MAKAEGGEGAGGSPVLVEPRCQADGIMENPAEERLLESGTIQGGRCRVGRKDWVESLQTAHGEIMSGFGIEFE